MSDDLNLSNELLREEQLLDVEAHVKRSDTEEPAEDKDDDEVEAHVRKSSPRKI